MGFNLWYYGTLFSLSAKLANNSGMAKVVVLREVRERIEYVFRQCEIGWG